MNMKEAVGLICSMCFRMFGLLVLIAESVVRGNEQRKFVAKQRDWLLHKQNELDVMEMANEVIEKAGDAE